MDNQRKTIWKAYLPYALAPIFIGVLVLIKWKQMEPIELLLEAAVILFGLIAAVGDAHSKIVPNALVVTMICSWILILVPQLVLQTEVALALGLRGLAAFLLSGLVLLLVYIISRKGIGGGDVKFVAAVGLYLGVSGILSALLFGSVLAALVGGGLILFKKIGRKDQIPLVPFLYAGILLTIFI